MFLHSSAMLIPFFCILAVLSRFIICSLACSAAFLISALFCTCSHSHGGFHHPANYLWLCKVTHFSLFMVHKVIMNLAHGTDQNFLASVAEWGRQRKLVTLMSLDVQYQECTQSYSDSNLVSPFLHSYQLYGGMKWGIKRKRAEC